MEQFIAVGAGDDPVSILKAFEHGQTLINTHTATREEIQERLEQERKIQIELAEIREQLADVARQREKRANKGIRVGSYKSKR